MGGVLAYPTLKKRLQWNVDDIARYLMLLRFKSDVVSIEQETAVVPLDSAGDIILRTLLAGRADFLVSGDIELLMLADQYPIIAPADFAQRIF